LGVLNDLAVGFVSVGATLAFSAVHGAFAPWILSGQHASPQLSVRRELVDHRLPLYVFGCLVCLVAMTIGVALILDADGAGHPSTIASVFVAVIIVIGGPRLTATVRRRSVAHS
jgi:hypothetical protein